MNPAGFEIDNCYEFLKEQSIIQNEQSVATWSKYKSDVEQAKSLLSTLPKKVKHDVMVPIGPKALMRGAIVHTNEFLVNLGETWFAKRTASQTLEICDRRIKTCDEMLQKLEKERELILNKTALPAEQEAFGSEERPEIIEYVTEEENDEWMQQHRTREKEYRKKLAELKNKERKPIETEEDLWKHLDQLELQEELEDELNRLNAENSSSEESCEESLTDTQEEIKENEKSVLVKEETRNSGNVEVKRKVSFACVTDLESDDEPLRLEFTHSDVEPAPSDPKSSEINSPSDIYKMYLKTVSATPRSVLKSDINPNKEKELRIAEQLDALQSSEDEQYEESSKVISSGIHFNDVVEKHSVNIKDIKKNEKTTKRISKFKALRTKT